MGVMLVLLPWLVGCVIASIVSAMLFRRLLDCGRAVAIILGSTPMLGWSTIFLLMVSAATESYPPISAEHPDGCDGWLHPCGVGPGLLSETLFAAAGLCALTTAVMILADAIMLIVGITARTIDAVRNHRG